MARVTRPVPPITRIASAATLSDGAARACAAFGVVPHTRTATTPTIPDITPTITDALTRSRVAHITGPSGSGKSTLLRAIAETAPFPVARPAAPLDDRHAAADALDRPIDDALAILALCGLAEPRLWALPAHALSTGQRARLDLARRAAGARRGETILIDEFATPLDRVAAAALAGSVPRLARTLGIRIITACAHEDIPLALDADTLIDAASGAILPPRHEPETIRIERATLDDYRALKHHHYRVNEPAAPALVLRAVRNTHAAGDILAGVLVVTRPTLNAAWRRRAWGDRYDSGDKRTDAHRLNDEVRVIARIIVEPRSRSLGVASRLVRAYLEDPITTRTEALAAMGARCPLFARAGMTEYGVHRDRADLRLLDALDHARSTPRDLLTPGAPRDPLIARELASWARARKHDPDDPDLSAHAAMRLIAAPRAYAHDTGENNRGTRETRRDTPKS